MTEGRRIRVVLAKPGLDGHDRGVKVVARGLRDAGMEVIYTGLRQTPEAIARVAGDEDCDVIALSILSGAHVSICRRLSVVLADEGMADLPIVVGGIIPGDDVPLLEAVGVRAVFGPGSSLDEIAATVRGLVTVEGTS